MTTTNNETGASSVMLPKTCLVCLESCDFAQNPLKEVTPQHRTRMHFLLTKLMDFPTNCFEVKITSCLNVCSKCYEMIETSNRALVRIKREEKKLKTIKSALRKSILTSENERRLAEKTDATATSKVYEKIRKTVCSNVSSDEQSKNLYQSRPIGRPPLFGPTLLASSGPDIGLDVECDTFNEPEITYTPASAVDVEGLQDPLGEFPTPLVQQHETEPLFSIQQYSPSTFLPKDQSESVLGNCEKWIGSIGTNLSELDEFYSEMNGIRVLKKCSKCDLSFLNQTLLTNHEQQDHIANDLMENNLLKCGFCEKCFGDSQLLVQHFDTDHANNTRLLAECADPQPSNSHQKSSLMNNKGSLKCAFCEKSFSETKLLVNHFETDHANTTRFDCYACELQFSTLAECAQHIKLSHSHENSSNSTNTSIALFEAQQNKPYDKNKVKAEKMMEAVKKMEAFKRRRAETQRLRRQKMTEEKRLLTKQAAAKRMRAYRARPGILKRSERNKEIECKIKEKVSDRIRSRKSREIPRSDCTITRL